MSPRIGSRGCAGKGERYFADGLREFPDNRRLAILAVCAIGWQSGPLPDHAGLHRRRRQQQRVDDESRGTGVGLGRWSRAGARVRDRPLVGLPAGLRRAGGPHRRFPERSALAGRGVHGGRTVSPPPRLAARARLTAGGSLRPPTRWMARWRARRRGSRPGVDGRVRSRWARLRGRTISPGGSEGGRGPDDQVRELETGGGRAGWSSRVGNRGGEPWLGAACADERGGRRLRGAGGPRDVGTRRRQTAALGSGCRSAQERRTGTDRGGGDVTRRSGGRYVVLPSQDSRRAAIR